MPPDILGNGLISPFGETRYIRVVINHFCIYNNIWRRLDWTNHQIHSFLTSKIYYCMLTHVKPSAVHFIIKQQAGKIAPSFHCHLRKTSDHFKVNGKSFWGILAMRVEFVQCHSSCSERLQPKDNRHTKRPSGSSSLIMNSVPKVQQCHFIALFLETDYACHFYFGTMKRFSNMSIFALLWLHIVSNIAYEFVNILHL